MEDYEDLEEKAPALAVVTPDTPEDAILSAGRSGGSRPLSRNLADELEEVAGPKPAYDDYDSDAEDSRSPVTMAQRPNKPQATGPHSTETPRQLTRYWDATGERSPYFQDSHMVTPKSVNHTEHVRTSGDNSGETRCTNRSSGRGSRRRFQLSNDSSDDDDDSNEFTGNGGAQMNEYLRQIREVTDTEMQNVTPRVEVATHRPLGQIKAFSGLRTTVKTPCSGCELSSTR
ncbi:unnamed protein product [Phytophthora lilii]|uniref:Unnamed protein product n=1 Tax=Phytophthora lilii TaxID=2077276 RepID=A0A9W7CTA7_9STRA|nr:unnamed protein product [Phytophthora lilii]